MSFSSLSFVIHFFYSTCNTTQAATAHRLSVLHQFNWTEWIIYGSVMGEVWADLRLRFLVSMEWDFYETSLGVWSQARAYIKTWKELNSLKVQLLPLNFPGQQKAKQRVIQSDNSACIEWMVTHNTDLQSNGLSLNLAKCFLKALLWGDYDLIAVCDSHSSVTLQCWWSNSVQLSCYIDTHVTTQHCV